MEKRITAVLIDTSAYHNRQCDFSGITSEMIPMFIRLMETNHIPVLSHPILNDEILKHIRESQIVDRAAKLCISLRKNKAILEYAGIYAKSICNKISSDAITDELIKAYEEFAKNFVMLPYVDAQEVFADYFNTKPPFSATGDKKAEFPDAFVLKGLLRYCSQNPDAQVLVISDDSDWKNTLAENTQIEIVDSFKDALVFLWKQLDDKAEFVWRIWSEKTPEIMAEIASEAESDAFSVNGIYAPEDIEVTSIRTTNMMGNMTPMEITENSVLVHVTAGISVDGVVDYLDEGRSVWDREDNVYYFMAYSRMHFHDASAEVECEVRLGFPADGSMKPIEIQSVRITNKRDICIDVSDAEVTYEDITDYGEDAWRAEQAEALEGYHNH